MSELLLIDTHNLCKDKTNSLEKLCYQITTLPDVPATLINIEYPERNLSHIIESTKHGKKRDEYRDSLLSVFTKNIFKLDADPLIFQWNEVSSKWFLPKLLGQNKILKVLRPLSITGKINKDKVVEYFDVLKLYQKEQEYLSNNSVFLSKNLDFLWNNGNSEWSAVAQICDTNLQINSLIISLTEDANKVNEVKGNLANHLSNGTRSFLNLRGKLITTFITLSEEQKKIENSLFDLLKIDFKKEPKTSIDWITYWRENAEDWLVNLDSLRNWTSWNRIKEETIDKGLSAVVETYSKG